MAVLHRTSEMQLSFLKYFDLVTRA